MNTIVSITCIIVGASMVIHGVIGLIRWYRLMKAVNAQIEATEEAIRFQREMAGF